LSAEKTRGQIIQFVDAFAFRAGFGVERRQLDASLVGQELDSFWEIHALHPLDESNQIAALIATETMPRLPRSVHVKTRRLFLMERATCLETPATCGFELEVFTDDIHDVETGFYLLRCIHSHTLQQRWTRG